MPDNNFLSNHDCLPWYSRADAKKLLEDTHGKTLNLDQKKACLSLIENGYCVLPKAISNDIIDSITNAYDLAGENRDTYLVRKGGEYFRPGPLGIVGRRKRLIDFYVPCTEALEAVLAKPVTDLLRVLYCQPPLAFQSLLFQFGSKQTLHQDPAYVVIERPQQLLASWIALEDVEVGSGELMYFSGSHQNITADFDDGESVWNRSTDSIDSNLSYSEKLTARCEAANLKKEHFLAKKGDVLIWHANLAHGGGEVNNEDLTRKSLVTHYCPEDCAPNYFLKEKKTAYKKPFGDGFYSSRHYDIRPESNNPQPVYTGGKNLYDTE